jgi:CrcB protein
MFKDILFVGLGGGIGSIMRFLTSRITARLVAAQWLFLGTLATNLIGCFLIGILSGWML